MLRTKRRTTAALLVATTMLCQSALAESEYQPPRLPNGQPDFQGTWTNKSVTSLTRPERFDSLTLSPEQARQIAQAMEARAARDLQPTDPDAPPPPKGTNVGGYNLFWTEPGEGLAMIDGEYRTSWIVDPASGQLPYTEQGRKRFEQLRDEARQNTDGPEIRPMTERCIIGFGSTGGPPMLNVGYNSNYEIVQTDEDVMILVEMVHDARIVDLNGEHGPIPRWLGDSVGRWDGDTLVIETRNFMDGEGLRLYFDASYYVSPQAEVTERLTRISDDQLFYQFEVRDPAVYSQPWRGEMVFNKTDDRIFEYACHEGNYALTNVLSGARKEERDQQTSD
ncbi:hypothetical protein F6455_14610 [Proteobacteria bacterium 005FR1]|nr:hypothetical protein [Proteobacteria bacterium 005FR1]